MRQQKWCTGIYYEQILVQMGTDTMLLLVYKYQQDQGILAHKGTATHHLFPYSTDHNPEVVSWALWLLWRLRHLYGELSFMLFSHVLMAYTLGGLFHLHPDASFLWLMLQVAWLVGAPALHLVALLRLWTEAQDVCASITICAWDQA